MKNPNAKQQQKVMEVLKKHESKLRKYAGVYDVGMGYPISNQELKYGVLGILVYVNKKVAKEALNKEQLLPTEIDGIKVDVIETDPQEHDSLSDILEGLHDPLVGGIYIGNASLNGGGTLGMIVKQKGTGQPLGLTNWHVIKQRKGDRGNPIIQPAWQPNNNRYRVGNLHRWNKRLDCAVFEINDSRSIDSPNSLLNINGRIKALQDPFIGMRVMKSGAKTGVTYGIVSSVSSNLKKIRVVRNPAQDKYADEITDSGDSGAVWVTDEVNKKAVALHWGGDKAETQNAEFALTNNIKDIFDCLDLELFI
ncbi:MAG: hypothetical protein R2753_15600 [Chitinophagales bacterium]